MRLGQQITQSKLPLKSRKEGHGNTDSNIAQ